MHIRTKGGRKVKMLKNEWFYHYFLSLKAPKRLPAAAAADLGEGVRALAIEVSNFVRSKPKYLGSGPKGDDLLGLVATRATARFLPSRGAGRGPGTGHRCENQAKV